MLSRTSNQYYRTFVYRDCTCENMKDVVRLKRSLNILHSTTVYEKMYENDNNAGEQAMRSYKPQVIPYFQLHPELLHLRNYSLKFLLLH
jgi:hypothetical protein